MAVHAGSGCGVDLHVDAALFKIFKASTSMSIAPTATVACDSALPWCPEEWFDDVMLFSFVRVA